MHGAIAHFLVEGQERPRERERGRISLLREVNFDTYPVGRWIPLTRFRNAVRGYRCPFLAPWP